MNGIIDDAIKVLEEEDEKLAVLDEQLESISRAPNLPRSKEWFRVQ